MLYEGWYYWLKNTFCTVDLLHGKSAGIPRQIIPNHPAYGIKPQFPAFFNALDPVCEIILPGAGDCWHALVGVCGGEGQGIHCGISTGRDSWSGYTGSP